MCFDLRLKEREMDMLKDIPKYEIFRVLHAVLDSIGTEVVISKQKLHMYTDPEIEYHEGPGKGLNSGSSYLIAL